VIAGRVGLVWACVVAGVLATAAGAVALVPADAAPLTRCTTASGEDALCGRVAVPLDRTGLLPGAIRLRVRALPPRGATAAPDGTVLALAGGPGQAAVPLLHDFASVLAPALRTRQLVTFDQRGTGGSGRLRCNALSGGGSLVEVIGRCAGELGPRRTAYTSATSVADVEAVRRALGVERLILFGASYGTKVALLYAATYPQHVERLVLDSVVLPEGVDPFQRATLASIPRVLRATCQGGCPFTSNPASDVARLARRLARRPLRGAVIDGDGRPRPAALGEPGLLALLLTGDFDRFARAATPAAVRAALAGDAAPLLRLTSQASVGALSPVGDSDALYAATTCEDGGVPWPPGTPTAQRRALVDAAARAIPDAAFAPFDRKTVRALGTADLCRAWPESPIVQALPPLPSIPTLILSGDDDLRTPRADAATLARRLPGARMLPVQDAAHGVLFSAATDCAERAVADFLDGRDPSRCARRPRAVAPAPLPPRRLAALRPVDGLAGRTGRTVTAIVRTLDDATDQLVAQLLAGSARPRPFGGLRAGSAVLERGRGLRLRAYAYVPGVTVSGTIPSRGARFAVTVGGSAAARGRVIVSRRGLAGVLGGERIVLSARMLGWRAPSASVAPSAAAADTSPPLAPPALAPFAR
jgi:pimeloyl-ACP methyl ester carboxylesterase